MKTFYTNGIKTIKLEDGQDIPEGFYKGRTFKSNPWNKGLTKETDPRVLDNSLKTHKTRKEKNNYISWNTGLTKETNETLLNTSQKISQSRIGKSSWNKGIKRTPEQNKKQSLSMMGSIPWNKGLTKETNGSLKRMSEKMLNHECFVKDWNSAKEKEYQTKTKNKSFNTSKPEDNLYKELCIKYGKENVLRQYRDERYPFNCDFYIKTEDLFIELNYFIAHCSHPYDKYNKDDIELLNSIKNKQNHKGRKNLYH